MNFFEILIENENEMLFQKRNRNWKIVWTTAMLLFIPYGFLIYYFNEFLRGFPILRAIITTTIFVVARAPPVTDAILLMKVEWLILVVKLSITIAPPSGDKLCTKVL